MIVLIRINSAQTINNPPLGLLYIGDALKKAGYEVKIYHICEDDIYKYVDEIVRTDPIWVGFSVNTGWSMTAALNMSKEIKKHSELPIVWGNAHPSLLPEQCLREDAIDFVVIGEGEITAVELTEQILNKETPEAIRGIGYKNREGDIVINETRELIENLDQYEMDWTLLDPERYVFAAPKFGMKRAFQFITSRGCPHSCGFCYNQRFNRGRWRSHSDEFVTQKVLDLKKSLKLDGIRFWDDNFFTNKNRAFSILERIDLPYTSEIRVNYFDEAFAKKLQQTKCKMVLLGLESGCDRILTLINKNTTKKTNMAALQILNHYPEISIHPSFIVGFPTETEAEFKETLELFADMIRTRPNFWFIRLGIYVAYPGCEIFDLSIKNGLKHPQRLEDWDRLVFDSSNIKAITCVDWLESKDDINKDEEYLNLLHSMTQSRLPYGILAFFVQKRIKNRYYSFQIERLIFISISVLVKTSRSFYNKLFFLRR